MGSTAQDVRVLDPGIAADIPFTPGGADDKAVAERLRTALKDHSIDVVVQPLAGRRKRLFVADMDPVVVEVEAETSGIPEPKLGLVTKAHGGVLFIDEIGEMAPALQTKLLKVLEDKRVIFESSYYDEHDPNVPAYVMAPVGPPV